MLPELAAPEDVDTAALGICRTNSGRIGGMAARDVRGRRWSESWERRPAWVVAADGGKGSSWEYQEHRQHGSVVCIKFNRDRAEQRRSDMRALRLLTIEY